eukprot:3828525-Amphidinium_carterae.3
MHKGGSAKHYCRLSRVGAEGVTTDHQAWHVREGRQPREGLQHMLALWRIDVTFGWRNSEALCLHVRKKRGQESI